MRKGHNFVFVLVALVAAVSATPVNLEARAVPTPLDSCPASSGKTTSIPSSAIVVAADGSGSYTTVQAAVNSISSSNAAEKVIYIKAGTYVEQVLITKNYVTLVGDGRCKTIIAYNANHASVGSSTGAATVQAQGTDFRAFHITFMNYASWPVSTNGQAPALYTYGARSFVQDCGIESHEDTLLIWQGTAYFKNCFISGDVDFVWGYGTAIIESSTLYLTGQNSQVITAHGGTSSSYSTGFWIHNSKITAASSVTSGSIYLGRPWMAYAYVVYSDTNMPAIINSAGWNLGLGDYSATCKLGEVAGTNTGTGATTTGRVSWSKQFTSEPDVATFLGGSSTSWLSAAVY